MKVNRARAVFSLPFRGMALLSAVLIFIASARAQDQFPAKGWAKGEPANLGLDPRALGALDADVAGGQYGLVDTMLVIRCGQQVYERAYAHDYGKIYGELAKNADLSRFIL